MSILTYSDSILGMVKQESKRILSVPAENDVARVNLLKGLAITAVIIIHIFSSIPGHIYTAPGIGARYIFFDQVLRFSVPLFIALSGYALTKRYGQKIEISKFYTRRILRIVPLYLLWSIGLWLLFNYVPEWFSTIETIPFWKVVLLGRGDYHLYFVPVIFQLYLLFPFVLKLLPRFGRTTLFVALVIQAFSLIFFKFLDQHTITNILSTDQEQYSLFTSWIFYFVLGMSLSTVQWGAQTAMKVRTVTWLVWGLSLAQLIAQAQINVSTGVDPLDALKFTRLVMISYATSSCMLAVLVPWETFGLPKFLTYLLHKIGKHSFLLYLSHTLVLRLFFAHTYTTLTFSDMLVTAVFLIAALNISYYLEKRS